MKIFLALILAVNLAACNTTANMVRGIGDDTKAVTDWTASKIKPN
jgi:predicted small secreted protein